MGAAPAEELALDEPLTRLPGVGPARASRLARLGLESLRDLLLFVPRRLESSGTAMGIAEARQKLGEAVVIEGVLERLRFHRFGLPGLYCTWARLAWFGSALSTNLEREETREEVYNAGAQLNLKLVLFSSLESTVSVGWAQAMADGSRPSDEFMASLKILR